MADWLNALFLHGTMSSQMKTGIVTALGALSATKDQAKAAIYLVTASSQYQVQR